MDTKGLAKVIAAFGGHDLDQEEAKTKLLQAQANKETQPTLSDALIKSLMGDQGNADQSVQTENPIIKALGISKNDLTKSLIAKSLGIDLPQSQTERADKLNDEVAKKELVSMSTNLPKLEQALQSINQLEGLYSKGATPDENPAVARFTGIPDAIRAKIGLNPNLNSYINNSKAFSGLIAKGGFGESGMLTNQDIERVVASLPTAQSTQEEAKIGFDQIKQLLQSARNRYEEKRKSYLGGNKDGISDLAQSSKYKSGDTKVINGKTYIRNEAGQWLTQ